MTVNHIFEDLMEQEITGDFTDWTEQLNYYEATMQRKRNPISGICGSGCFYPDDLRAASGGRGLCGRRRTEPDLVMQLPHCKEGAFPDLRRYGNDGLFHSGRNGCQIPVSGKGKLLQSAETVLSRCP